MSTRYYQIAFSLYKFFVQYFSSVYAQAQHECLYLYLYVVEPNLWFLYNGRECATLFSVTVYTHVDSPSSHEIQQISIEIFDVISLLSVHIFYLSSVFI